MMLYTILLCCSLLVPISFCFDRKLQFWRQWKFLFPSILFIAVIYIAGDILMTQAGHWGFNPRYHLGIVLAGLPLEEWLFFLVIPYASVFLHDVVVLYLPSFKTTVVPGRTLQIAFILFFAVMAIFFYTKTYTVYSSVLVITALLLSLADHSGLINHYWATFLFILLPFTLVNGILTGFLIDGEVVWYSEQSITGYRLLTIPVEDYGYGFSLILFVLLIRQQLICRFGKGQLARRVKSHEENE